MNEENIEQPKKVEEVKVQKKEPKLMHLTDFKN